MRKIFSFLCPRDPVCGAIVFFGLIFTALMVTTAACIPEESRPVEARLNADLQSEVAVHGAIPAGSPVHFGYCQVVRDGVDVTPEGEIVDGENIIVRVHYAYLDRRCRGHRDSALLLVRPDDHSVIDRGESFGCWREKELKYQNTPVHASGDRYLACLER